MCDEAQMTTAEEQEQAQTRELFPDNCFPTPPRTTR